MPNSFLARSLASVLCVIGIAGPVQAGGAVTGATEFTQILNNSELIALGGQNAEQIANQVQQIGNQIQMIENQISIYENMLQNTLSLPMQVWGEVEQNLGQLQSLVQKGQAMAFSMGNLDDTLKQRFQSYADFAKNGLPDGQSFSTMYQSWSDTNRDTISSTLKAAGYTSDQFATEEATMRQLRQHSQSAAGQKQALQVGHEIAAQQVEQMQKLRGLVSQQMTMMGTWYQSEQTARDHTKAASDQFFKNPNVSSGNGQDFKPQW
ncbi:P-type conjugative transfer protein TrbJ (plasmid) [Roseibium algicola]|uniref:P-type conjugative transfer protein TrbJ n=1 Tax=Roseibium algicola TaxID=2857014 RepID=A0ABM6IC47_9HYPH|nr:P-type conjugative transfer protein TrbJ [Roseibium aggregatum]AQQ08120.1 P-type conjugative transfer protein TrbJ [Roseibium aggregatum]